MRQLKRTFDLIFTVPALILLTPLFAVVAAVIKCDDRGPVFFLQERVGYRGKKFMLWKFRSMAPPGPLSSRISRCLPVSSSPALPNYNTAPGPGDKPETGSAAQTANIFGSVSTSSSGPGQLTVGEDPRITRVGRWLRRTKIDELPQLINVLKGEMSLVGPRPEVPRYVALYSGEQRQVLELVPGITDPASIKYRRESELLALSSDPERTYIEQIMPDKIQINLEYARQATLLTDFKIILTTLRLVLKC